MAPAGVSLAAEVGDAGHEVEGRDGEDDGDNEDGDGDKEDEDENEGCDARAAVRAAEGYPQAHPLGAGGFRESKEDDIGGDGFCADDDDDDERAGGNAIDDDAENDRDDDGGLGDDVLHHREAVHEPNAAPRCAPRVRLPAQEKDDAPDACLVSEPQDDEPREARRERQLRELVLS